jgi:hypothetical protein
MTLVLGDGRESSNGVERRVRAEIEPSFLTLKSSRRLGASRLRRFVSLASVFVLLTVVTLSGTTFAQAQTSGGWNSTGWVSSGSIQDLTGNSNLAQGEALLAGHTYNMTLQINVPNTSTSTPQFQVSLNSRLLAAPGQSLYWAVHTSGYQGYNRTSFTGGSPTVTFNYVQGTVKLSAYFKVPVNFTNPSASFVTPSGNLTRQLHLSQEAVTFVAVVPVGSTGTGSFLASVEDQTIQTYLTDYNQTSNLVPSGKIPSAYSSLVNPILAEAQALYNLGFPDQGTSLLGALVPSAFPVPPSSSLQTYLLAGFAGAVVVVILLAVMMLRSRGKSGYSEGLIGEVQKDLAVLEVTAAKYDRAMADKLKSLRDKLGETS